MEKADGKLYLFFQLCTRGKSRIAELKIVLNHCLK